MFDRIKDIIFKIKDYDRLEHDYSLCLCYFTNNRLSKTNYEIKGLEAVICDTIGEYRDEGYEHGKEDTIKKACEWLSENLTNNPSGSLRATRHEMITKGELIKEFRKHMKNDEKDQLYKGKGHQG